MKVTASRENEVIILAVSGRLDAVGASEFEATCTGQIQDGEVCLLLDLAGVDYISSAGLRALLVVAKAVKSTRSAMVLCSLSLMVREVLEISGFDKLLTLSLDREAALAALSRA